MGFYSKNRVGGISERAHRRRNRLIENADCRLDPRPSAWKFRDDAALAFSGGTVSLIRRTCSSHSRCLSACPPSVITSESPTNRPHRFISRLPRFSSHGLRGWGGCCGTLGFIAREFPFPPFFHSVEELAVIFLSCVQELSY